MARFVVSEWLMGLITPRLSPLHPFFQLWSMSGVMEDRNTKRVDSHMQISAISDAGTQLDLTNVTCHRLSQCRHPNTKSLIDPLLISLCTSKAGRRTTMATKTPQAMDM